MIFHISVFCSFHAPLSHPYGIRFISLNWFFTHCHSPWSTKYNVTCSCPVPFTARTARKHKKSCRKTASRSLNRNRCLSCYHASCTRTMCDAFCFLLKLSRLMVSDKVTITQMPVHAPPFFLFHIWWLLPLKKLCLVNFRRTDAWEELSYHFQLSALGFFGGMIMGLIHYGTGDRLLISHSIFSANFCFHCPTQFRFDYRWCCTNYRVCTPICQQLATLCSKHTHKKQLQSMR